MPLLHLLAGPNGAGKSSYVRDILVPVTQLPVINADEIAAERIAEGASFISKTVFSHPSKVQLVADAVEAGYLVHLHVIMVPVELTVQRVLERVRRGGHVVPEQKIRDRYDRLWEHVSTAIRLADVAEVLDNSSARMPFRACARFAHGALIGSASWPVWTPAALNDGWRDEQREPSTP